MMLRKEVTANYGRIYDFVCKILSVGPHFDHLPTITAYILEIYRKWQQCRFYSIGVPRVLIQSVISEVSENELKIENGLFTTETIFHNNSLLPSEPFWACIIFSNGSRNYIRTCKLFKYVGLPSNALMLCSDTLFNIRQSLSHNPFKLIHWSRLVSFKVNLLKEFHHQEAVKLVISYLKCSLTTWSNEDTKRALALFFETPRFLKLGDIVTVKLDKAANEFLMKESLRFRVHSIEVEGGTRTFEEVETLVADDVFVVTTATAVYEVESSQGFTVSSKLKQFTPSDVGTTFSIVPPGMEIYFERLLASIRPFLYEVQQDLQPVFILDGPSGCGKTLLLSRVSEYLGLGFLSVDSYDLVSNVQSHILAATKGFSKLIVNNAPCIVELFNGEVLSSEGDGVDSEQIFSVLSHTLNSLDTKYPVIVVFSTTNVGSFKHNFINLALQQFSVDKPSEERKGELLNWLGAKNGITLSLDAKEYLKTQTSSFILSDLERILCSCSKRTENEVNPFTCLISDLKLGLEMMNQWKSDKVGASEWQDVGGVEEIKREVLNSLLTNKLMPSVRRTGILLYGPPGTGKTLLARTVASQCGRSFVSVKGPELLNMYVGQSESNIRQVFQRAKDASPCIMFFDELDSLAPNRGNKSDAGGVMDRVVSQLLAEIDSIENEDVFILGATNRPDLLDPALLRPGRFDKKVYVGPCEDDTAKMKVLKALTRKFVMDEDVLGEVVKCVPDSVTGANLYALCSAAWMQAARKLIGTGCSEPEVEVKVQLKHFQRAAREVFNAQEKIDN